MKLFKIILLLCCPLFSSLSVDLVASKFDKPLYVITFPSDNKLLLVIEQDGIIRLIKDGEKIKKPFIDISKRVHKPLFPGDERGLLGFAFDPDYINNGYFYVNYINKEDYTVISRFSTSDNIADNLSEVEIMKFKQPYSNHNGGCMEFSPDGYLYISIGDGGSTGDPEKRAQNLENLFGTIIRIKINDDGSYSIPKDNPFINHENAKQEIWSYGLRNVWRFSFDKLTGDMIMGDVGQHLWEEINFEEAGEGGKNYGWNIYEGKHCYPEDAICKNLGYEEPIFEYPNNANYVRILLGLKQKTPNMDGCSITGGYVYRGQNIKDLYGRYIFGDYCTGKIWSIKIDHNNFDIIDHTKDILSGMGKKEFYLSSFGQDNDGEIFIIDYNGSIYKLKDLD